MTTSARRPLVLASTSVYRQQLLTRIGLAFTTAAPEYDERAVEASLAGTLPRELSLILARGKAESLAATHPDHFILGSDQIPYLPGDEPTILHKPGTREQAVAQLMSLSGRTHEMVTAVVLLDTRTGKSWQEVDHHFLTMRAFGEPEARAYIETYQPLDCAGSYRIEDPGLLLFDRIEGCDYTGVIGMPMLAVHRLLRAAGLLPADVKRDTVT